jgi:hypothetical protein
MSERQFSKKKSRRYIQMNESEVREIQLKRSKVSKRKVTL